MEILQTPISLIKKQEYKKENRHRWSKYVIRQKDKNNNYIIHNMLNDCVIKINKSEFIKYKEYLVKNWFFVPIEYDETPNAYKVREKLSTRETPTFQTISSFTILTTTDCNAQCYYCYEFGRNKIHMTEKIANDVADFIIKKNNGQEVVLRWFGGEPLYNEKVIDIITSRLREVGIKYKSSMISNAYLISEEKVDKYIKDWGLRNIQITLDGYGDTYNSIKNYIYEEEENAFDRVINNIDVLIRNKIRVSIRLNLSSINKEDIIKLIEFCGTKWRNNRYFSMYAHNIFDEEKSEDEDFLEQIYKDLEEVENIIIKNGVGNRRKKIKRLLKKTVCMGNSGKSVVINPWGQVGLCEHYSETEMIGNIYKDEYDKKVIDDWNERFDMIDLCEDCPLFPSCYRLKKCENSFCNKFKKELKIKEIKKTLIKELKK